MIKSGICKKSVFFFTAIAITISVSGQAISTIWTADSLKLEVYNARIEDCLKQKEFEKAKLTNDSALRLALSGHYQRATAEVYFNYGYIERARNNTTGFIDNLNASIEYYERAGYYRGSGKALFLIGQAYVSKGDEKTALEYFRKSYLHRERAGDSVGVANSLTNVATLNYKAGNYDAAADEFFTVLELAKKLKNDKLRAICLSNLTHLSNKMNNYGQSLRYLDEALQLQRKLGNRQAESNVFTNYGTTYTELKNYQKAREAFFEALKIKEEINDEKGIAATYSNLAIIAKNENDTALSRKYVNMALAIARKIGDKEVEANAYSSLALLSSMNNSVEAEQQLLNSLKKAKEINNPLLVMANYKNLKEYYEKKGEHRKALEFAGLFESLNDSTFKTNNADKILELQTRYETAEKERQLSEITRQKLQQELQLQKANQLKYSLIGLSLFLLVMAALLYSRYRLKKRSQEKLAQINMELNELNTTKDKLFSIISHDLKNSVSAFINITDTLNTNFENISHDDKRYLLNEMSGSAGNMKNLFRNLLDWARSQRNLIKVNAIGLNLTEIINENIEQTAAATNRKNIIVNVIAGDDLIVTTDRDILNTVVRNILNNAVKFSPDGGEITIHAKKSGDSFSLSVHNTGAGISPEELEELRNNSNPINSKPDTEGEKGAGLGLMLTRELLLKISGQLEIQSQQGKGSTFTVLLPATI
ncbi:MAG TPA: tetratricopeptide repeat protein [Bacteroidales bacterium]|jgi:signal transduction histidine kinase/tetratricopeptide (TPR) repeat protein|nr:tetratricopeptide repeat protein [Bacteroidales bacterium]